MITIFKLENAILIIIRLELKIDCNIFSHKSWRLRCVSSLKDEFVTNFLHVLLTKSDLMVSNNSSLWSVAEQAFDILRKQSKFLIKWNTKQNHHIYIATIRYLDYIYKFIHQWYKWWNVLFPINFIISFVEKQKDTIQRTYE